MIRSFVQRSSSRTFRTSFGLILLAEIVTIFVAWLLLGRNVDQWIHEKTILAMRTSQRAAASADWSLIDKIPKDDRDSSLFESYSKKLDNLSGRQFRRKEGSIYLAVVERGEAYEIDPGDSPPMTDAGKANQTELDAYALRKPTSTAVPISDDLGTYLAAYTPIIKNGKVIGLVAAEYDSATLADLQGIVRRVWLSMLPAAVASLVISYALASKFVEPMEVLREIEVIREQDLLHSDSGEKPWGLTDRQLEVFESLGDDLTNAQIAARLSIDTETVKTHMSTILKKSGLKRWQLIVAARERRARTGTAAGRP